MNGMLVISDQLDVRSKDQQRVERRVWCTFFGLSSTSVILEGSTMGLGLRRFSIRLCHWVGRPTKQPCLASNEVWTRCSKFLGADISGLFFFFLRNILRSTRATACPLQNVPVEKSIQPLINCTQHYIQHMLKYL